MDSRIATLAATAKADEPDFNTIQFEKRLSQLKDSQDSINAMSAWCLENRIHHKKIVNAWLNVLKKVKVEHRLTLFYLANDVIQYSKRKNYDFVESWGTTLQKATTMVREEKVKNRILRIFKIWEQRGIYGEEFIADLSGLISASPAGRKDQDPNDFQPTYLITRIRSCAKLESDTDLKLKVLKDNAPKIVDSETLCASLKDRQHVEDVEKDVEGGITLIEGYVNALKAEIKSRTHLISVLTQADAFYINERKEVKVVVSAYKNFTTRVKNLKRKLDELTPTLSSPIPSPDVNAPSPEPDSDLEIPNLDSNPGHSLKTSVASGVNVYALTDTYSAGYYTPASSGNAQSFTNNGFSSFIGSNMPFDLQNFNTSNIFSESNAEPYNPISHSILDNSQLDQNYTPQPVSNPIGSYQPVPPPSSTVSGGGYNSTAPLLPPPMPPFTTSGYMDTSAYTDTTYAPSIDSYANNATYQEVGSAQYAVSSEIQSSYQPAADAYNPEEDLDTWEPETTWDAAPSDLETPESPPMFEKEGFSDPIEYDETKSSLLGNKDVDHRVLLPPPQIPPMLTDTDTDHRMNRLNPNKDVDHRNLISLTGSPGNDSTSPSPLGQLDAPSVPPPTWEGHIDQDYRINAEDQDYRVPVSALAEQLKLPPPPPPPPFIKDNVDSIDMDLSDDEVATLGGTAPASRLNNVKSENNNQHNHHFNNKKPLLMDPLPVILDNMQEPPPPIVKLPLLRDPEENHDQGKLLPDRHMVMDGNQIMVNLPPPPPIQLSMPPPSGPEWNHEPEWFDSRLPPDFSNNFPPPGRHKNEFHGGYRGRPHGMTNDFRGGRPLRIRGMRTRPPRIVFGRPPRGAFRGNFRGGF